MAIPEPLETPAETPTETPLPIPMAMIVEIPAATTNEIAEPVTNLTPSPEPTAPEVSIEVVSAMTASSDMTGTADTSAEAPLDVMVPQSIEPHESIDPTAALDTALEQPLLEDDLPPQDKPADSDLDEKLLDDLFATWAAE